MMKTRVTSLIPSVLFGLALLGLAVPAGADIEGRYKINDSGDCYFDANDEGPDQCQPPIIGRWKVDGAGACYFDGSDNGPNQCEPGEAVSLR